MAILKVQEYLRKFKDPSEALLFLEKDFHIQWKREQNLVIFNYHQFKTPSGELTNECRGLILEYGTWNVVSKSFYRFLNFGEKAAALIDWQTAVTSSKVDGSLIVIYTYKNETYIQTRGKMFGDSHLPNDSKDTYSYRVKKLLNDFPYPFKNFPDCCFVFEYCSPDNRIVTYYSEDRLYLLTVVNKETLDEWSLQEVFDFANKYNFLRPELISLNSVDIVVDNAGKLPATSEGYVVFDKYFNRIKIKNPSYVALHHLAGNKGRDFKHFFEVFLKSEQSEFLSYFPEYEKDFKEIILKFHKFEEDIEWQFIEIFDNNNGRKAFALRAKEHPLSSYLFYKYDHQESNFFEWCQKNPDKIVQVFESLK